MDALLTVGDIAALLKLHPKTVRAWVGRGVLPAIRLGGRELRFRASDVEAAIETARTGSSVPAPAPRPATRAVSPRPSSPTGTVRTLREDFWRQRRSREDRQDGGPTALARGARRA